MTGQPHGDIRGEMTNRFRGLQMHDDDSSSSTTSSSTNSENVEGRGRGEPESPQEHDSPEPPLPDEPVPLADFAYIENEYDDAEGQRRILSLPFALNKHCSNPNMFHQPPHTHNHPPDSTDVAKLGNWYDHTLCDQTTLLSY